MKRGTVVSIGTFDGIHLGHQAILRELRLQAKGHSLSSLVYAFSVPPRWALRGDEEERYLLLTTALKVNLLDQSADLVHSSTFESVRSMDPEDFIETVLINQLRARVVVEGESFRFGRNRTGDLGALQSLGAKRGLEVISVPPVMVGDEAASSTRIRNAIRTSDFQTARDCLGRSPILVGTVVRGDQLGRKMRVPTANLDIDPHVLLPNPGIFLVHALGQSIRASGLLYIGSRPTFEQSESRCEVHLLDFSDRQLYGEVMEIHLLQRIRDDRSFPSLGALRSQIEADIETARKLLPGFPLIEQRISS
jgi:riboflavin kinase / FMN adenylyltransferase